MTETQKEINDRFIKMMRKHAKEYNVPQYKVDQFTTELANEALNIKDEEDFENRFMPWSFSKFVKFLETI